MIKAIAAAAVLAPAICSTASAGGLPRASSGLGAAATSGSVLVKGRCGAGGAHAARGAQGGGHAAPWVGPVWVFP
jgi:hypothetical protein